MSRALRSCVVAFILATLAPHANGLIETRLEIRERLLERINSDRSEHDLRPVELDLTASEAADEYCGLQVETGTRGHVSVDGLSPYMRYSFAGIDGYVLENVAAWSSRQTVPLELVAKMAERSHEEMMSEQPPDDGHRRAILDPYATHVGIGVAWGGGEVRIAELFLRRHVEWLSVDRRVKLDGTGRYRAKLEQSMVDVDRVTVHYEPFPYRLSRERANRVETYALPPVWQRLERTREPSRLAAAIRERPRGSQFELSGNELSFDVAFTNGRGVYTIVVWAKQPGEARAVSVTNLTVFVDADSPGSATGF